MRTVQMTLDPHLVISVDRAAKRLGLSRSAFTRRALAEALARLRTEALEQRHTEGYRRKPVKKGEFDTPQIAQSWPD
jgi:metal-responsive CopG/Arc/MetJ family transcriptional regulator